MSFHDDRSVQTSDFESVLVLTVSAQAAVVPVDDIQSRVGNATFHQIARAYLELRSDRPVQQVSRRLFSLKKLPVSTMSHFTLRRNPFPLKLNTRNYTLGERYRIYFEKTVAKGDKAWMEDAICLVGAYMNKNPKGGAPWNLQGICFCSKEVVFVTENRLLLMRFY